VGISCFFLQAEEGLRVFHVTGVQACALPIWLAHDDDLAPADVEAITRRLDRLDRASAIGPWTRQTLELIAAHPERRAPDLAAMVDRKSTRLNSSHVKISYAVFCLKKKKTKKT